MDQLGYAISYWHAQMRFDPAVVDKVLTNFNSQIDATLLYLSITLLLQTILFLSLPWSGYLEKRFRARTAQSTLHKA
jgi:hypothetical protein